MGGNTLLEVIDIEKTQQEMGIQYLNQIERALFGEFNNGQTADFPRVRMKKAHWLPWVVFKPELCTVQQHQAAILASERNPIDQVCAHLIESLNINDATNANLTLESMAQIHADKLKHGKVVHEFLNLDHSNTDNYFTQEQKGLLKVFMDTLKAKADYGGRKGD